ncbi:hypothetical protein [Neosynechococcus sphagnicola]|uniref:hypothetical protein n=1 Tax=Neosynechococcus sphagnicola TaxID=1501145 RepID=UPI0019552D85|nr:hypothetical protein [Neosynechococcus sphagnicola]
MINLSRIRPFEPAPYPGLKREQFTKICKNGFGDGHNSHAHSMAWFKNRLYVGTTRSVLCVLKQHMHIEEWNLETWPVECPSNLEGLYQLDRRAQIWCYDPEENVWQMVHRAPLIVGTEDEEVPREVGYRAMAVFQGESDQEPTLYVATTSPGRGSGALILRSIDGNNFTLASDYGILGLPVTSIRVLVSFKGRLFTSPTGTRGGQANTSGYPVIYESRDPAQGKWQAVSEPGFGESGNEGVFMLCPFADNLYAGTFNCQGYQIWRTDVTGDPPYKWVKVIDQGAWRGPLNQIAPSLMVFKNCAICGECNSA